jgi:hypothetical protein
MFKERILLFFFVARASKRGTAYARIGRRSAADACRFSRQHWTIETIVATTVTTVTAIIRPANKPMPAQPNGHSLTRPTSGA